MEYTFIWGNEDNFCAILIKRHGNFKALKVCDFKNVKKFTQPKFLGEEIFPN